jgi:hypothetical protein
MDRVQFWRLIEEARRETGGDCDQQVELLQKKLSLLSEDEIIAFAETMEELLNEAYTWELWAASSILNGGSSDDGFEYFRLWLIAQGEQVFSRALADPETLADYPGKFPEPVECEALGYIAEDAYEEKTGHEMPDYRIPSLPLEPRGQRWEEGQEVQLYPRLAARVGYEVE